jgi:BirA family transcriptional regulator, biotin operon repressor / biotin---[acetyl-CoA-carboxylase] ligase
MFELSQWTQSWSLQNQEKINFHYLPTINSTNDWAKSTKLPSQLSSQLSTEKIHLFTTDQQTHGRGRGANTWLDQQLPGQFFSTWALQLRQSPQPLWSPRVGLALYKAVKMAFNSDLLSLKAPNDLYLDEKKIAGLLIESVSQGDQHWIFIGLGLNLYASPSLSTAGALLDRQPEENRWNNFLNHFLAQINEIANLSFNLLTETEQNELKTALQSYYKNRTETDIEKILPDGSLLFSNGKKINWSEL